MTVLGMTLNYIDIAIVAIVVIAMIIGYCRGLMINIINFIRISLGFFLCFYLSSNGAPYVYNLYLKERCLKLIQEKIVLSSNVDEIIQNLNDFGNSLPHFISDNANFTTLDLSSDDIAQSILMNVFEPVVLALTKAAIFIAVFIIFFGATALIIHLIRKHSDKKDKERGRKSVIKKTDKWLGMLFGLLKSVIIVLAITSVLMYILSLMDETKTLNEFWVQVQQSRLIALLNEINPFNAVTEELI